MKALLIAALFVAAVSAVAQPYLIQRFESNIQIHADSSLSVQERISVLFHEPRHGIIRKIPVDYDTGRGYRRRVDIGAVQVKDGEGKDPGLKMWKEDGYLVIRIGDPDVTLSSGTEITYVIDYTVTGAFNWFEPEEGWTEGRAELYWNVTGDEWDTTVEATSCRIRFPKVQNDGDVQFRVFAGPYGSRVHNELVSFAEGRRDSLTQTTISLREDSADVLRHVPLYPGGGLTVVLGFPAGHIHRPPLLTQIRLFLLPNLGLLMPLLVGAVLFFIWSLRGKDPPHGPIAVQYDPPDNLTGPEAGAMLDERVDAKDIAAGIVSLATKGYITIERKKKPGLFFDSIETFLHNNDKPIENLTAFEILLLSKLRSCGDTVREDELRKDVAPHLSDLQQSLYNALVDRGYYPKNPNVVRNAWLVGGLIAIGIATFLVLGLTDSLLPTIFGGVASAILVVIFATLMPARTQRGASILRDLKGFEEFITRANGKELDWMSKKHPDMALFEAYLPHAVAFGATKVWVEAFQSVLHEPPAWYVGSWDSGFGFHSFGSDLERAVGSLGSAASTPPRSSGASGGGSGFSSGGGFSGGGFGGGGGSSW